MICEAVIEKLITDDGLVEFKPGVVIGQTYLVDITTIRRGQTMVNTDTGSPVHHVKDIIFTVDGVWLPLELIGLKV